MPILLYSQVRAEPETPATAFSARSFSPEQPSIAVRRPLIEKRRTPGPARRFAFGHTCVLEGLALRLESMEEAGSEAGGGGQ